MLRKGLPGIPPAERCYRAFWWRKGDVFRLLMSLQNVVDGCTWPKQEERAVQQLQGLIHHVTGQAHAVLRCAVLRSPLTALTTSALKTCDHGHLHTVGSTTTFVHRFLHQLCA